MADVKQMVLDCTPIEVIDAKTGENLTRQILLQILLEEEASGAPLFSDDMICQFIRLYGQASQSFLVPFLEQNMQVFQNWQQRMQDQAQGNMPWLNSFGLGVNPVFAEWQQQLQQQSLQFWQSMGMIHPHKKSDTL
ncbi:polyhydroxyalkanoate synthesis regulator DNA-binding domain-containing protein [Snodgrassella sp. CFCC 13594]|uniref:polyhydroxyalkanoate synthesis regulator DNA-binding domain-containing protein n=1 Tax=Snodgrassella sp. CFCC 13594 TaxID=1775559 RepID=UPI001E378D01|nr:polyhydroxyalkanoate synthesis regulator DNA-binding domain-containing protein [Snodgrassella sp. CFCC 13594]